jgi:hypothetical protein
MRLLPTALAVAAFVSAGFGAFTIGVSVGAADPTPTFPPPLPQSSNAIFQSAIEGRAPIPPVTTVSLLSAVPITAGPRSYDTASAEQSLLRLISSALAARTSAHPAVEQPANAQPTGEARSVSLPDYSSSRTTRQVAGPRSTTATQPTDAAAASAPSGRTSAVLSPAAARSRSRDGSGNAATLIAGIVALAACVLLGAAWLARRRRPRQMRTH